MSDNKNLPDKNEVQGNKSDINPDIKSKANMGPQAQPGIKPREKPAFQQAAKPETKLGGEIQPEKKSDAQTDIKAKTPKTGRPRARRFMVLGALSVIILFVIIFVAGTGVVYASNRNIPVFSDVVETVEKIVASEQQEDEVVQDFTSDMIFSMLKSVDTSQTGIITMNVSQADIDEFIKDDLENVDFRFDIFVTAEPENSPGTFQISTEGFIKEDDIQMVFNGSLADAGFALEVDAEVRTVGDTLYIKVNELPTEMLDLYGLSIGDEIVGQWIHFTNDQETMDGLSELLGFDIFDINALSESQDLEVDESATTMEKEDLQNIYDFIHSDEIAKTITRADDKVIDGVRANCFEMNADKNNLAEIILKLSDLAATEVSPDEVQGDLEGFKSLKAHVCKGRRDDRIYEATIELMMGGEGDVTEANIELTMTDYDDVSENVSQPENSINIMTLIEDLLKTFMGSFAEEGIDETEDGDNLQDEGLIPGDLDELYDLEDYEKLYEEYDIDPDLYYEDLDYYEKEDPNLQSPEPE